MLKTRRLISGKSTNFVSREPIMNVRRKGQPVTSKASLLCFCLTFLTPQKISVLPRKVKQRHYNKSFTRSQCSHLVISLCGIYFYNIHLCEYYNYCNACLCLTFVSILFIIRGGFNKSKSLSNIYVLSLWQFFAKKIFFNTFICYLTCALFS